VTSTRITTRWMGKPVDGVVGGGDVRRGGTRRRRS